MALRHTTHCAYKLFIIIIAIIARWLFYVFEITISEIILSIHSDSRLMAIQSKWV